MRKNIKIGVFSLFLLGACSFPAAALDFGNWGCDMCPYVGAEAGARFMDFEKAQGEKLAPKCYFQGNLFLGLKFNECFGIEGGIEGTPTTRRKASLTASDPSFFGVSSEDANNTQPTPFSTSSEIRGWHLNLVGFYPLDKCMSLMGSIGIASLKAKIGSHPLLLDDGATPINPARQTVHFEKKLAVARLGLGLQYMFNHCLGTRLMGYWENTARFKNLKPTDNFFNGLRASLKNSLICNIGLFYNF